LTTFVRSSSAEPLSEVGLIDVCDSDGRLTMQLVAYLRVSTDKQAEDGLGLDVQEHAIRAWAKRCDHTVVQWCADEGVSGSNGVETRVALYDALDALRSRRAAAMVVYRLDRLARDLVLQEQLLADVWRAKARVFSTSASEDAYLDPEGAADDPSRALIRQVLGAVAEYERAMIRLRLRSGIERKKAAGRYAGGQVPFGWRVESRELVRDEAEQLVLARMRELRAAGASLRAIAARLEREGVKPRRAARWHAESVRQVLGHEQPAE
jgi:DNA invertase Pin-like site-specific DNA recombinase